jgi:hypothetical protein
MNIALFAPSGIFRAFQSLLKWWARDPTAQAMATPSVRSCKKPDTHKSATMRSAVGESRVHHTATQKPLRVFRMVEANQSRTSVGRMVISGRMSDVCAELERLAAVEASLP